MADPTPPTEQVANLQLDEVTGEMVMVVVMVVRDWGWSVERTCCWHGEFRPGSEIRLELAFRGCAGVLSRAVCSPGQNCRGAEFGSDVRGVGGAFHVFVI